MHIFLIIIKNVLLINFCLFFKCAKMLFRKIKIGVIMIKIVLDVNGGDYSPTELVLGAIKSVKQIPDLNMVLCGPKADIEKILNDNKCDKTRFEVVDAPDTITNMDVPTVAIKQKTESSLYKAIDLLKNNSDVCAMVSAGSTGAVLTGAFLRIGRIKGVSRPAICPILPTVDRPNGMVAIIDSGANVDCKPINLVHFAIMGNAYLKNVYGIESPRVALLNIGTEEKKGNELLHETYPMLKDLKDINFVGNMEGRELLSGNVDLVVTDGFGGNVLLKSTEGAVLNLLKLLKDDIKSSPMSLIGAMFMKGTFKRIKQRMDYNKKAGGVLLGCKKLVVKAHGSSKAESIYQSILLAYNMHKANLCEIIEKEISKVNIETNE